MEHYYLCEFTVYRNGNKNSRPHTVMKYIIAKNIGQANKTAKAICRADYLKHTSTDFVQAAVECTYADKARQQIEKKPGLLISKYEIVKQESQDKKTTISTFFGDTQTALVRFRSFVFKTANSGKYGDYPEDMTRFNDLVEAGFSDNGLEWSSANDTTFLTVKA